MEFKTIPNAHEKHYLLSGRFTFADNKKFNQIIELLGDGELKSITLDFADLEFIDSAGLGMLLLLRDECENRKISILLQQARGQVEQVFLLSRFDQLFTIKSSL
jgi:anti-anti-sigma factor